MALKLGELLIAKKLLSPGQLEEALHAQKIYGGKLGTNLIELSFISDGDLVKVLSEQLRLPPASAKDFENIPIEALNAITLEFAHENQVVPLALDQRLHVGISDPSNIEAIDQLSYKTGKRVQAYIAPEVWIQAALERCYNIPRPARYVSIADPGEFDEALISHDISTEVEFDYKDKYTGPQEIITLPTFVSRLAKTEAKEKVFELLFQYLGPTFSKMAVYVVRKDRFSGWMVHGFPVHAQAFMAIELSLDGETPLKTVFEKKEPICVKSSEVQATQIGFKVLRIHYDRWVPFYPVLFRGKVIAILMGLIDNLQESLQDEEDMRVRVACQKTGWMLEMIALKKQVLSLPATL